MNDPFRILGISQSASDDEVKEAYRNLMNHYAGDHDKIAELTNAFDSINVIVFGIVIFLTPD